MSPANQVRVQKKHKRLSLIAGVSIMHFPAEMQILDLSIFDAFHLSQELLRFQCQVALFLLI